MTTCRTTHSVLMTCNHSLQAIDGYSIRGYAYYPDRRRPTQQALKCDKSRHAVAERTPRWLRLQGTSLRAISMCCSLFRSVLSSSTPQVWGYNAFCCNLYATFQVPNLPLSQNGWKHIMNASNLRAVNLCGSIRNGINSTVH